jgi:hypothetical protein
MYLKGQEIQEFDINDPRNPGCPCHKYQKLADEEYKKLLASAEKKNEITISENGTSSSERDGGISGSETNENGVSSSENKIDEEGISLAEKKNSGSELNISGKENNNNSSGRINAGGKIDRGNFSGGSSQKKGSSQNHNRYKRKKHIKKHPLWNRVKSWRGWDVCKESRVVSACFHWK